MAYMTIELYSAEMGRETMVMVLFPTTESEVGKPCLPGVKFDGVWLLPCKGGSPTNWMHYTRHCAADNHLVVLPDYGEGAAYERFIARELPAFLTAGFPLREGSEYNAIGAHPDNAEAAQALFEKYPDVFGTLIAQAECKADGWWQAEESIKNYYASKSVDKPKL
jgi:hypothetical protein